MLGCQEKSFDEDHTQKDDGSEAASCLAKAHSGRQGWPSTWKSLAPGFGKSRDFRCSLRLDPTGEADRKGLLSLAFTCAAG